MLTTLDDLLPYVEPELPGAPVNFIRLQLKSAARRFFDETEAWQTELKDLDLIADQASYDLDPGILNITTQPEVRRIVWVTIDGLQVPACDYNLEPKSVAPFFQLTFVEGKVPKFGNNEAMDVRLVLVPSALGEELPEYELNKYMEGIRSTLMYAMTSMTNTKWFSPSQSEKYRRLQHKEFNSAKREKLTNFKLQAVRSKGYDWI